MCCGQKRSPFRNSQAAIAKPRTLNMQLQPAIGTKPRALTSIRYLENSPVRVLGPVSGLSYVFSGAHPIQQVDSRDAPSLLSTRLFRSA